MNDNKLALDYFDSKKNEIVKKIQEIRNVSIKNYIANNTETLKNDNLYDFFNDEVVAVSRNAQTGNYVYAVSNNAKTETIEVDSSDSKYAALAAIYDNILNDTKALRQQLFNYELSKQDDDFMYELNIALDKFMVALPQTIKDKNTKAVYDKFELVPAMTIDNSGNCISKDINNLTVTIVPTDDYYPAIINASSSFNVDGNLLSKKFDKLMVVQKDINLIGNSIALEGSKEIKVDTEHSSKLTSAVTPDVDINNVSNELVSDKAKDKVEDADEDEMNKSVVSRHVQSFVKRVNTWFFNKKCNREYKLQQRNKYLGKTSISDEKAIEVDDSKATKITSSASENLNKEIGNNLKDKLEKNNGIEIKNINDIPENDISKIDDVKDSTEVTLSEKNLIDVSKLSSSELFELAEAAQKREKHEKFVALEKARRDLENAKIIEASKPEWRKVVDEEIEKNNADFAAMNKIAADVNITSYNPYTYEEITPRDSMVQTYNDLFGDNRYDGLLAQSSEEIEKDVKTR